MLQDNKRYKFSKDFKLLQAQEFTNVFENKVWRYNSQICSFLIVKNDLNNPRIGFIISKKNIKQANKRNRIKRLLREYIRLNQHTLPNADLILIAKPLMAKSTNSEINQEITTFFQKLDISRLNTEKK
ncbi:ribonuclease P protein component [Psittacicella hinzii]|nr:ribonuclease P protein component [Psittacicella hinzii]